MPKHGIRLIILIVIFSAAAVAAKSYFTVNSFYRYGHYRADSVGEIAAGTPKYQGPAYCQGCHEERHATWSAGTHLVVKCEVCHGPAGEHPVSGKLPVPDDTVRLCTLCHEAMPTRPAAQPQIEVAEHAGTQQCIVCHNPHSPKIGGAAPAGTGGGPATAEALAAQCSGCHGDDGRGVGEFPALAGKQAEYIAQRMLDYKSGTLKNPMMNMIAEALSDQDITALAAHYAALGGE
jgi:cytochrome c553